MEAIREYVKVVDHKINISQEVHFDSDEVEIIILPVNRFKTTSNESFVDFIRNSPLADEELVIERSKSSSRDVLL